MSVTNEVDTRVDIKTRADGKYDFYIYDVQSGNLLCSSDQGYDQSYECRKIAERVVGANTRGDVTFNRVTA